VDGNLKHSPIIDAIQRAEEGTTGEIRVHLTQRLFEKDAYKRATQIFSEYGMNRTAQRNAVLLYINLRKKKFAIIADMGFDEKIDPDFWNQLGRQLTYQLRSTERERAIGLAIETVGDALKKWFPIENHI
jgi:uncharacterized membrane protein